MVLPRCRCAACAVAEVLIVGGADVGTDVIVCFSALDLDRVLSGGTGRTFILGEEEVPTFTCWYNCDEGVVRAHPAMGMSSGSLDELGKG